MARLDSFLRLVAEQHASDLHLHAGNPPIVRLNGDLVPLPFRELSDEEARRFVLEVLNPAQRDALEQEQELDFVYELPGIARFRGNAFQQSRGLGAVFRVIPSEIPNLDQLRFPRAVSRLVDLNNGLVLVTGPTGSGKTTTLAAIVHEINLKQQRHIVTIEDPIEFIHTPVRSVITQREVGQHTESFAAALRSALRESPDVVVVGELRDLETVTLALSAAETGVLVFGTLHTNSAAKSVHRIVDMMPEGIRDQARGVISVLLRAVVAQRLCKRRGGEGRIAVLEVLLQDYAVSHMIREDKLHQLEAHLQSQNPESSGMQSFDRCLLGHVRNGLVDADEALRLASYPDQMAEQLRSLPRDED
jgi:twitching motility protein PilT